MPRFAANLSMLYPEHGFADRFAAAAQDGFSAVEILFPYEFDIDALAGHLQRNRLSQILINTPAGGNDAQANQAAWKDGLRGTASLPGREHEFRAGLTLALATARGLDCPNIHVMAGVLTPGVARAQASRTYIENLKWACDAAARHDITLLIEPINTRDIPGYFLNRQDHAHEILAQVGAANLKVQMDLYHCQIVEGDVASKLAQYLPSGNVGHMQIAGVPQRHEPDLGELHYPFLFEQIDSLGYTGWMGCEYRPRNGTSAGLSWLQALRIQKPAA